MLRLGLTVLYLTTHDKQGFYQHVGYQFCAPIVSVGSATGLLSEEQVNQICIASLCAMRIHIDTFYSWLLYILVSQIVILGYSYIIHWL